MNVKISTNGKFHAITIHEPELAANMTEDLRNRLTFFLQDDIKNLVIIMKDIQKIDSAAARELLLIRNRFHENQASFVLCDLQPDVKNFFRLDEQFESLQITPTFSEASDMVYLEEIEREMMD
ncbi:MAG: STAS domain-containing protein [Bacteroidota bacterium]|nr:STAS domain-containing protein [Bacteroidota bacterium]MDP4212220.1 STAS domain-containing protein [Bacteroidota bacterium]MDP4251752.1 STAS domain-containing protein [Bacteroidota bacterium]